MQLQWKKYPENVPDDNEYYLITLAGRRYITIAKFDPSMKQYDENYVKYHGPAWEDLEMGGILCDVIAFAELPEPFDDNE